MLAMLDALLPLSRSDLMVGRPLPFPVFDRNGELLLAAGQTVQSEVQLQLLCTRGLYRSPRWQMAEAEAAKAQSQRSVDTVKSIVEATTVVARGARAATDDAVGTQTLKMMPEAGTREFSVRLLGVNPETSLIVTAPIEEGKLIFVKEGQSFRFQGLFGEAILSFSASVLKVQFAPFPYIHLSWPDRSKIQRKHVRTARRAHCRLPCVVYLQRASGETALHGFVVNLSTGGAEIVVPHEAPDVKDAVRMAFRIIVAGRSTLIEHQGYVIRRKGESRADGVHYGVRFTEFQPDLELVLNAYILELLVTQLECPLGI